MRFSLQREALLKPLAQVVNVVERRQTLPVLANLLLQVEDGRISLTGTDLEVEMVARAEREVLVVQQQGATGLGDLLHAGVGVSK